MVENADVVIVGAGLYGASAAFRLSRLGVGKVVVLDGSGPGSGDSGRTFGMVRHHYSNDVTAKLALRSIATFRDWRDEVGVGDPGYVPCGYLVTTSEATVEGCRANAERSRRLGGDERFVEPGELADIEPLLAVDGIAGGAYESAGGYADVHRVILGWLTAAAASGAELRFNTTVLGFGISGSEVTSVRTDQGDLSAGTVVVCAGAWGRDLLSTAGVSLPISLRRVQVAVLEAPPGAGVPSVVCSDAVSGVVVRPEHGRRFWTVAYGGESELESAEECDHALTPAYAGPVHAALSARYPALASSKDSGGWAGIYDYTPDWHPIVGRAPGLENLFVSLGSSGHGFKLAPALGECLAAEITGSASPIDIAELGPGRFDGERRLALAYGPGARA